MMGTRAACRALWQSAQVTTFAAMCETARRSSACSGEADTGSPIRTCAKKNGACLDSMESRHAPEISTRDRLRKKERPALFDRRLLERLLDHPLERAHVAQDQRPVAPLDQTVTHELGDLAAHRLAMGADAAGDLGMGPRPRDHGARPSRPTRP